MVKIKKTAFTLIELLIVVAILGIIAAIGTPIYNGFINNTKMITAKNSLRNICMVEADYFSENSRYLTGLDTTAEINTNLFNGKKTLDEQGDYNYKVVLTTEGYQAIAERKDGSSIELQKFCVDHTEGPPTTVC